MSEVWERQPNEPLMWFDRFDRFRLQGAGRNMEELWRNEAKRSPGARPSSSWYERSREWQWWQRAQAWDAYVRAEEQRKWEERRAKQREREWKTSQELLDRVDTMLMFPLMRTTKTEGEHVTIIEPIGWRMSDIGRFAETASKIARLASEMATENVDVMDWRNEARKDGITDPEAILNAAVAAFREQLARTDDGGSPAEGASGAGTGEPASGV